MSTMIFTFRHGVGSLPIPHAITLATAEFALAAVSEYQAGYFYAKPESEKDDTNPDVFRCQKNQHTTQDEQGDGYGTFGARIFDHGDKEIF